MIESPTGIIGVAFNRELEKLEGRKAVKGAAFDYSLSRWVLVPSEGRTEPALKKNPVSPEGDCSPNAFPILRRVPRLPSRMGNKLDHASQIFSVPT